MEIYRVPRREVAATILLGDGRALEGALFTAETSFGGGAEDVLHLLNGSEDDFIPLVSGKESFLLGKRGIVWVQLTGEPAHEIRSNAQGGRRAPVRLTLAGGLNVVGTLMISMPPERSRIIDYLNAPGRFMPLFGEEAVTLVQRRFIVSVKSLDGVESA